MLRYPLHVFFYREITVAAHDKWLLKMEINGMHKHGGQVPGASKIYTKIRTDTLCF